MEPAVGGPNGDNDDADDADDAGNYGDHYDDHDDGYNGGQTRNSGGQSPVLLGAQMSAGGQNATCAFTVNSE